MTRALILGRFQPPHRGHLRVIEKAAAGHDEVLVLVGSAQASYTPENPFTAGERLEMLHAALDEAGLSNVRVIPVPDLNRHAQWVAYVDALVPPYDVVITNNPLTRLLFTEAGYRVEAGTLYRRNACSGTRIRKLLAEGKDVSGAVPSAVAQLLSALDAAGRLGTLGGGHADG